jgi:long-chain fatty acid transport protein
MSCALSSALVLAGGCLLVADSRAQTNDDVNAGIQFNFSTPGARSLAMGGAFLALADDATAAYTNPAGLTNLTVGGSEVTVELRQWSYTNIFPDRGHIAGAPSGIGIDTVGGLQDGTADSRTEGLSFLSVGYVVPGGWTLAVYRHQLASFEARATAQGFLQGEGNDVFRVFPSRSRLNLEIANYGLAAGYRLLTSEKRGSLSVGLGLSYYQSEMFSSTERFSRLNRDEAGEERHRQPGGFFGPADFLGDNLNNTILQEGQDSDWGFNLGLLWRSGGKEAWRLGAAYRRGPSLASHARFIFGPAAERADPRNKNGSEAAGVGGEAVLHVPDVYGVGVAWSPARGKLRLTLDADRVEYSRLLDGLTNVLLQAQTTFRRSEYRIPDADELHLGVEYVFFVLESKLVGTARFGAWQEPDHALDYVGSNPIFIARFRPGEDQVHVASGLGFVIGENFQLDVAYDHSDRDRVLSVALVKFF